jgi:hypothetical protein
MTTCALKKNWARSRALGPSSVRAVHMSNSGCEQAAGQERSHARNNQHSGGNWNPDASRPDGSEKALPAGKRRKGQAENSSRKGKNRFSATRLGLAKSRRKIQTAEQLTATGVQRGTQGIKEEKDEIWPVLTVHTRKEIKMKSSQ